MYDIYIHMYNIYIYIYMGPNGPMFKVSVLVEIFWGPLSRHVQCRNQEHNALRHKQFLGIHFVGLHLRVHGLTFKETQKKSEHWTQNVA